jgi:hypothetical protein
MTKRGGGFDEPAGCEDEDHLGRWAFAREVATVATTAPPEWSVRIGVYGRWGYGKTSVLNFVRRIAEADGHVVAGFNPWGCTSEENMWDEFADAVLRRARELKIPVEAAKKTRWRLWARNATRGAEVLATFRPESRAIAAAIGPSLRKWLKLKGKELAAIPQALGEGKRVIVLIDDLDRTDPRLLPQMLFALREVLDTPGYSYVLALDPTVVGAALGTYHPGFGSGREFLEKIVEFPRWLPEPTDEDLWHLVLADTRRHCHFVDLEALRQEFDLFPRVPRQLKTFVRSFWLLRAEVERHDPGEISWSLLVLTQLLKNVSQGFSNALLSNEGLLAGLLARRFAKNSDPADEELTQLASLHVDPTEIERAVRIALRFGERSFWLSEQVLYHAFLTERPHPVTWREFHALRAAVPAPITSDAVRQWVVEHGTTRRVPQAAVLRDLFAAAVRFHDAAMDRAASSRTDANRQANAADADAALGLIEVLSFDLGGFTARDCVLLTSDFATLKQRFFKWANFDNTAQYLALRAREKELLSRIVREASFGPLPLLADLEPWNNAGWVRGHAHDLRASLAQTACDRGGSQVLRVFETDSAVASVAADTKRTAERYLLFRPQSPTWSPDGRARFEELTREGTRTAIIEDNCMAFIAVIADPNERLAWVSRSELQDLARTNEIILPAWGAATAGPVNIRMFSWLKEHRTALEGIRGEPLPEPRWWKELEGRVERSAPASARAPGDAEDETDETTDA